MKTTISMQPNFQKLNYTYKKSDSEVWVLNTKNIPVDHSKVVDVQLVHLSPGSVGGNHRHQRTEWFVGIGELLFVWLDEAGNQYSEQMHPDGKIVLVTVPPFLPHAVVNLSKTTAGILYEMADGVMKDPEKVEVYL
jgi:uncharacterized RmlC-like cupin family protein